jgi:hypothetical protein
MQSLKEPCMYVYKEKKISIVVYVNDVLTAAKEHP